MEQLLLGEHDECLKRLQAYLKGMDDASKISTLEGLLRYALENSLPTCTIKVLISFCQKEDLNVNCVALVLLHGDEEAFLFLCDTFCKDNFFYYEMFGAVVDHPARLETIIEWLKMAQFDILNVLEEYFGFYQEHLCHELPKEAEIIVEALYQALKKENRLLPAPEERFGLMQNWLLSLREDV